MRNRYPGECYRCKGWVPAGEGHFERFKSGWRVQHAACAIECRGTPDAERAAYTEARLHARAKGTGRRAQRARAALRKRDAEASA
jgi:hypothetical protein